jgi:hypothetical protein
MVQHFHEAFGLGINETSIATVDADGVALAAIQGLHQLVKEKDGKIEAQQHEIAELRTELDAVKRAVAQPIRGNAPGSDAGHPMTTKPDGLSGAVLRSAHPM